MATINEFFEQLGSDAALLDAYKRDPKGVMKANGLSDEAIEAIMSGDKARIDQLVGPSKKSVIYQVVYAPKDNN
ncbi:hypothetical protein [Shewanella algidipiscicola]|nr:hypothetical protein [Shewanella algidipiscicola]